MFILYIAFNFFPFLNNKWEEEYKRTGYSGNALLDGLAAHAAALKDFDLQSHHLIVQYLVPHSSHLTQPLDLVTFSLQKLITIKKCKNKTFNSSRSNTK